MRSTVLFDTLISENSGVDLIAVNMAECSRSRARGCSRTRPKTARNSWLSSQQESACKFWRPGTRQTLWLALQYRIHLSSCADFTPITAQIVARGT